MQPSDIISTVVGRGTRIKGSIHIKNSGRIDGYVEGGVTADQDVIVGECGVIEGQITSLNAIIGGKVHGSVNAVKRVVLEEFADLKGDIRTEKLKIADGARFYGYCYMLKKRPTEQEQLK
ncbi:hypothetical protein AMJ80_07280 [bacterium SM23_31]|nr:MAG: hypothetical protein AMJ80_07280 [bacterium SM23_31]